MISTPLKTYALALLLSVSPAQVGDEAKIGLKRPSDWVFDLFQEHPETAITDLVLPGTHDSGSYKITASSPSAPDAPAIYSQFRGVAASWSKTQDRDLKQQLLDGTRYLDLRVDLYEGELVLIHGLVSCPLKEELLGVREFVRKHPREPVILDIQDMPPRSAHDALDGLLTELFEEHLYQAKGAPRSWSLNSVWKSRKSLITLTPDDAFARRGARYQQRKVLDSVWTNTRELEDLRRGLDARIGARDRSKLQCAYLTFTPKHETIAADKLRGGRGLLGLSTPLFELPGAWLPRWLDAGFRPNIVSVDFYERTDLVSAVIAANQRLLAR